MARFEAAIAPAEGQAPAAGYVLQHQVRAPADLEIEKISLVQDGIDRVSRWTRDESGMISLFLTGPVTGGQLLSIDGWLPTPDARRLAVAAIRRRIGDPARYQHYARASAGGANRADRPAWPGGSRPVSSSGGSDLAGEIVAALVAAQSDYGAILRITANAPHVRATMVATVQKNTTGPLGQIDYRATVEDGVPRRDRD